MYMIVHVNGERFLKLFPTPTVPLFPMAPNIDCKEMLEAECGIMVLSRLKLSPISTSSVATGT